LHQYVVTSCKTHDYTRKQDPNQAGFSLYTNTSLDVEETVNRTTEAATATTQNMYFCRQDLRERHLLHLEFTGILH
jgi:hypothetical protein